MDEWKSVEVNGIPLSGELADSCGLFFAFSSKRKFTKHYPGEQPLVFDIVKQKP